MARAAESSQSRLRPIRPLRRAGAQTGAKGNRQATGLFFPHGRRALQRFVGDLEAQDFVFIVFKADRLLTHGADPLFRQRRWPMLVAISMKSVRGEPCRGQQNGRSVIGVTRPAPATPRFAGKKRHFVLTVTCGTPPRAYMEW